LHPYEQVGLLTCLSGHNSLLLDSRDYWTDVLQEGRPKEISCRCSGRAFRVELVYGFRENGDVRTVDVLPRCINCGQLHRGAIFEIKYGPTASLLSNPLDPIEQPWLKAKQCQITAYWQPSDAERFALYLTETLGARIYRDSNLIECKVRTVEFYPELKHDLYFTNTPDIVRPTERDPQKYGPILRLRGPFHIVIPTGLAHLYYIQWAEEILRNVAITVQPQAFVKFAHETREWLSRNYVSQRGRNTADNPTEFARIKSLSAPLQD
jgi:hypothetical protein